jgi:Tol biopolymer transport system component
MKIFPVKFGEDFKEEQGTAAEVPREFLPDSIRIFRGGLPCWSPDSRQIAFLEGSTGTLYVYHLGTGELQKLYRKEGILPFPGGWAPDGSFVLVGLMNRESRKSSLWKFPTDGGDPIQIQGHHKNFYRHMALSPDGTLLVYAAMEENRLGLFIMEANGGPSLPLALTEGAHNEGAVWSPDGRSIAFNSTRGQNADIWIMEVDPVWIKKELTNLKEKKNRLHKF